MSDTDEIYKALVAAQGDMPAVEPNQTNPHFKSKFVSLDHLIAKTRPVLNAHGLAIVQRPTTVEGKPALETRVIHTSGQSLSSVMPLILQREDMQGLGAAITYARRYAWAAALGICADEDDDGNQAAASTQRASGARRTASQPESDEVPVRATPEALAAYKGEVEAAGFEWGPVLQRIKDAGGTEADLARSRAAFMDHLATLAAQESQMAVTDEVPA